MSGGSMVLNGVRVFEPVVTVVDGHPVMDWPDSEPSVCLMARELLVSMLADLAWYKADADRLADDLRQATATKVLLLLNASLDAAARVHVAEHDAGPPQEAGQ